MRPITALYAFMRPVSLISGIVSAVSSLEQYSRNQVRGMLFCKGSGLFPHIWVNDSGDYKRRLNS